MIPLVQCFQDKLGASRDVAKALQDEQTYLTPTSGKGKAWFVVFCQFMIPISIYLQDVVTDSFLAKEYHQQYWTGTRVPSCKMLNTSQCSTTSDDLHDLAQYPSKLEPYPCFNYTMAFILMPIGCFFSEWYLHKRHALMKKVISHFLDKNNSNVWAQFFFKLVN